MDTLSPGQLISARNVKPCSSTCFYCFLFDLRLSHQNLDTNHCNFPKVKYKIGMVTKYTLIKKEAHAMYKQWDFKPPNITVDSRLILLFGFPSASMISRAYRSLWALFILRRSFQLKPSLPFGKGRKITTSKESSNVTDIENRQDLFDKHFG